MNPLSWIASAVGGLEKWLEGPSTSPATKQATQTVISNLNAAGQAAEAALPALAIDAADAVLGMIPGNTPFVGLEVPFIEAVIAELTKRKSAVAA